jgi:hypothetical protein
LEEAVRGAVLDALAARRAVGSVPVQLRVLRADWRPGRRTGDTVIYDAVLSVEFVAGEWARTVTAAVPVADPGSAGEAALVRAAAFRQLAGAVAAEGVAWLTLGQ